MQPGSSLSPEDLDPDLVARFWRRVERGSSCWHYRVRVTKRGYGRVTRPDNSTIYAHRFSWVLHHQRELAGDLTIDHRCRVVTCVNPDHLDAVTIAENVARTRGIYARTPKAHVARSGKTTWRVRFRTYDSGKTERSRTFESEVAALAWIAENRYQPLAQGSSA